MNSSLEAKLEKLPVCPGVYFHKDSKGEVIYVGKAAVLRSRVRQYFQDSRSRDNKTMALVAEIADIDWMETESEVDALFLESEMVKRYMPRYNVLLRDDKSQGFVRIDMKSEWPTVGFTRNPLDDGAEYYGPFYNSFALKKALRYLRKIFPYLTAERRPRQSRLNEDIGLSPRVSDGPELYKKDLRQLIGYIKGNRTAITRELEREMRLAASQQEFETAALLRNRLRGMQELQQRIMFGDREFLDISKDAALRDLQSLFGLKGEPARIEGYDVSHTSGSATVASMVVFINGVSARTDYRKFNIRNIKNDDAGSIYQVVHRRFSTRNISSWGLPDLILIDGGKSQLRAAIEALKSRELNLPVLSIAKREEVIILHKVDSSIDTTAWARMQSTGISIKDDGDFWSINLHPGLIKSHGHTQNLRGSLIDRGEYDDITRLFQRIRDESHRFAISHHASVRRKQQTKNILEEIPGVGPKTRAKLLKKFGSVSGLRQASSVEVKGIVGDRMAERISRQIGLSKEDDIIKK